MLLGEKKVTDPEHAHILSGILKCLLRQKPLWEHCKGAQQRQEKPDITITAKTRWEQLVTNAPSA